jgi:hypothetical protein
VQRAVLELSPPGEPALDQDTIAKGADQLVNSKWSQPFAMYAATRGARVHDFRALRGIPVNEAVHIIGHGDPRNGTVGGMTPTGLAVRLYAHLPAGYRGKIKLVACHSGDRLPALNGATFAEKLAAALAAEASAAVQPPARPGAPPRAPLPSPASVSGTPGFSYRFFTGDRVTYRQSPHLEVAQTAYGRAKSELQPVWDAYVRACLEIESTTGGTGELFWATRARADRGYRARFREILAQHGFSFGKEARVGPFPVRSPEPGPVPAPAPAPALGDETPHVEPSVASEEQRLLRHARPGPPSRPGPAPPAPAGPGTRGSGLEVEGETVRLPPSVAAEERRLLRRVGPLPPA